MRRLIVVVLGALAVSTAAAQQPSPTFRAGVDVLTIEASVLDRDGKPIIDLRPADFTVTLDGKPRRVRDARFYGDGGAEVVARAESTVPGPVTNSREDGRIVVFVVDRDSIAPGNEKVVLEAATTVIDGLSPADAAGVPSPKLIVMLGDYVDRGPSSSRVLEHLLAPPPRAGNWCGLQAP